MARTIKKQKGRESIALVVDGKDEKWYVAKAKEHYNKTTKFDPDFTALRPDLKRIPDLSNYEKSEEFYNNPPDIYERLNKNGGLKSARQNAVPFAPNTCKSHGCSEMNKIFDYFDAM